MFIQLIFRSGGRYPPKYPMIHDSGFLVLFIFRGFPATSQCRSASENVKEWNSV